MQLEQISAFKARPKIQQKLYEYGFTKTFKEGETILKEDSYIQAIPLVMEGRIKVMRSDIEGREILLYYIQAGESCIMSFLGGLHQDTSKISAIAEEKTEILFIPIDKVKLLIKEFPEWLNFIFKLYHQRFEELLDVLNAVAFKKMDQRLLDLIHKKADMQGSKSITITHEQLAHELGTARVVVSRLLKQMEQEGFVTLGRNKIHLL